ncbi:hypothetical protein [Deinococcus aquaedulcis]|uniref:hypothetical protein n=1 Tax=Deinococcus aquaedulcis TaxID=2840455 RepID=UPI001C82E6EA|nr:hypothetical protein [Deinococcus aquaedulcis]
MRVKSLFAALFRRPSIPVPQSTALELHHVTALYAQQMDTQRAGLWQYRESVDHQLTVLHYALMTTWSDQSEAFKTAVQETLEGLLSLSCTALTLNADGTVYREDVKEAFVNVIGAPPEAFEDPVSAAGLVVNHRLFALLALQAYPDSWTVEGVRALQTGTAEAARRHLYDGHPLKNAVEVAA